MIGRKVGPYQVVAELGRGGMATVYLGEAEEHGAAVPVGEKVALKVIHPHLLSEPGFFKRFLIEARAGTRIRSENVVRTLDVDAAEIDGRVHHYLVMEYVRGQTLRSLLAELGWLPEDLCRHIGREVSRALAAVHEAGIVHRDLKPENILISADERVKIMDLGVALVVDEAMRLSQTGMFVGSLMYAAPEQFRGQPAAPDPRVDLYALGMILYELVTGAHPFGEDSPSGVMERQLALEPSIPSESNPRLSPFFEEFILRLVAKKPENRFQSADEVGLVLTEGEDSNWWKKRQTTIREMTRRPLRRVRIPRETAIFGRERELEELRLLFASARAGNGRVALVEGEAGIGKSRLVDEFAGRFDREGAALFLFGGFPPGGAATPAGAFVDALVSHLGTEDLEARLAPLVPRTPLLVPAFAALLRGEPPLPDQEPLTRDSLKTVFVQAFRSLAEDRPLILLVDDLHFAPADGHAIFAALALAVPGHSILLLGTTRPSMQKDWSANLIRLPHVCGLSLERLGYRHVRNALAEALGSPNLAEDICPEIARKSDGNPYFLFEILRDLRERNQLLRRGDGRWTRAERIADVTLPYTARDLVLARIARLERGDRELLQAAACAGFEFEPAVVTEALGRGRIPTLKRLGRLERNHRIVHSMGRIFVFDHQEVRDILYEETPELLREEYHAAIGEVLVRKARAAEAGGGPVPGFLSVEICSHLLRGGRGEQALEHLYPALDALEMQQLNAPIVDLAARALDVPGLLTGSARAGVLFREASRLELLSRSEEEWEVLTEAMDLADREGDADLRVKARKRVAYHHRVAGRTEEAKAVFEDALEVARGEGNRLLEGSLLSDLGHLFADQGSYAAALERYEEHRRVAREAGERRAEAIAAGNIATVAWEMGEYGRAEELFGDAIEIFREIADRRGECAAIGNLGLVLEGLGLNEEAREHFERHREISREIGFRRGEAMALGNLGLNCHSRGRLAEALDFLETDLDIASELGSPMHEGITRMNLGMLMGTLGRLDAARDHFERGLRLFEEIQYRWGLAWIVHAMADIEAAEDRPEEAERLHRKAIEARSELGLAESEAESHLSLGRFLLNRGRTDEAREEIRLAGELSANSSARSLMLRLACQIALLPGGDTAEARRRLLADGEVLTEHERMEAHFALYCADGAEDDLQIARRILERLVSSAPPAYRDGMKRNVQLHREILAA